MNVIVGNKLKKLRRSKNLSQEEVAAFLEISQSAYGRMERGENASWACHFNKICEIYDITPEELARRELGDETYDNLMNTERLTEIAILSVYRKIINQYELQIDELKNIIAHLNRGKN